MTKILCLDGVSFEVADNDPRLPPPVPDPIPTVDGVNIVSVLSNDQATTAGLRDLIRLATNPSVPATNAKLVRVASAVGMTPDALFAAAQEA